MDSTAAEKDILIAEAPAAAEESKPVENVPALDEPAPQTTAADPAPAPIAVDDPAATTAAGAATDAVQATEPTTPTPAPAPATTEGVTPIAEKCAKDLLSDADEKEAAPELSPVVEPAKDGENVAANVTPAADIEMTKKPIIDSPTPNKGDDSSSNKRKAEEESGDAPVCKQPTPEKAAVAAQ